MQKNIHVEQEFRFEIVKATSDCIDYVAWQNKTEGYFFFPVLFRINKWDEHMHIGMGARLHERAIIKILSFLLEEFFGLDQFSFRIWSSDKIVWLQHYFSNKMHEYFQRAREEHKKSESVLNRQMWILNSWEHESNH